MMAAWSLGAIKMTLGDVSPFFFFFFRNSRLFIYLFIYGCVGSSFLCEGFL